MPKVKSSKALKTLSKTGNVVPYQSTVITVNQPQAPAEKVVSSEYETWTDIPIKDDTLDTIVTEYNPKETGINPILFVVPKADENLPDLSRSYIIFNVSGTEDGTDLAVDNAYFKNNVFHTLIKSIDVELNGTTVTLNSDDYHQEAYVTTVLNHSKDEQDTFMTCQGWAKDQYGYMDSRNSAQNAAITARGDLKEGKKFLFIGMPIIDLFKTDKLLPPGLRMDIKIYLNENKKIFLSAGANNASNAKLKVNSTKLYISRKVPNADLWDKMQKKWMSTPWTIPLIHTKLRTFVMGTTSTKFQEYDIFNGEIPKTMTMWMVPLNTAEGLYDKNQYNYERNNLTGCEIKLNSKTFIDYAEKLTDENITKAYLNMKLQDGSALINKKGPYITEEEFKNGYFILQFDLTRAKIGHLDVSETPRSGNLSIHLNFSQVHGAAVQLYVMGTFNRILEVDYQGNVTYPM